MTTTTHSSADWLRPTTVTNFFLGFSGGLPFPLVYATLSAWLEEAGLTRSAISTFAWIGFAYSFKFLWSPIVDNTRIPILTNWVGRRRAWLLTAQVALAMGLLVMSRLDPATELAVFAMVTLAVALLSATQDIVIDAYRIESDSKEMQGILAGAYQYGYRLALICSSAGALYLAEWGGWALTYSLMAGLMGVGILAVLMSREPAGTPTLSYTSAADWLQKSVFQPFFDMFSRFGGVLLLILAYVLCFRVSDYVLGILANPFYLDLGFSKTDVANVAKAYGIVVSLVGIAAGSAAVLRWSVYRCLVIASVLIAATNLGFIYLAFQGPELSALAVTISGDNFAMGFAGTVFIAYLAGLTNAKFTATQYALLSSLSAFGGKFLAKWSGNVQEWSGWSGLLAPWMTDAARDADWAGWVGFFGYAALTGIPSVVLALVIGLPRFRIERLAESSNK
ncbi:MAG: MFS transporter [Pseudomonadota bacterium]